MHIVPQFKQRQFLKCQADIAIYGGAAGGGKSFALLCEPLVMQATANADGFNAVFFRRTYPQLRAPGGLIDQSQQLYRAAGGMAKDGGSEWQFKNWSLKFSHLQHEANKYDWQGSEICLICFDELTQFTASQFWYLLSRNRSTCGVRPYIRATTNPDGQSWVRTLLDWWIDDNGRVIPERCGKLRWFTRNAGQMIWSDTPEGLADASEFPPKSLTFIEADIDDNPILLERDPGYKANLAALEFVDRERLLNKNWSRSLQRPDAIFKNPRMKAWPDVDCIGFVDTAYGGKNDTSLTLAAEVDGQIWLRGWVWSESVTKLYATIGDKMRQYRGGTLHVETDADKGLSLPEFRKHWSTVRGVRAAEGSEKGRVSKHIRIMDNIERNWHRINFALDTQSDYVSQILNYAEGEEPDDAPDSAAGAIKQLTKPKWAEQRLEI